MSESIAGCASGYKYGTSNVMYDSYLKCYCVIYVVELNVYLNSLQVKLTTVLIYYRNPLF